MECNDLYTSVEQRLLSLCAFCHFLCPQAPWTRRRKERKSLPRYLFTLFFLSFLPSFLFTVASHIVWCYRENMSCAIARNPTLLICFLYISPPLLLFPAWQNNANFLYSFQAFPLTLFDTFIFFFLPYFSSCQGSVSTLVSSLPRSNGLITAF